MSRIAAPAFPFTHDTFAGPVTDPIDKVADGTYGTVTATITGVCFYGTGGSTHARIILTADNGTMTSGYIDARNFRSLADDLLLANGTRVTIRGTVKRQPGLPAVIDVRCILPTDVDAKATALAA